MDNQKDFYIKEKLQKDKIISKKVDDVFNNFFKGEFSMKEEIKSENSNDKNLNIKEQLHTEEQSKTKVKRNKGYKNLVATAASVLVLFGAANVYAMTQGYENIFFMIKYLTTGEQTTITDKNEILSDRDITISFEPIKLTDKIDLQVKNLQIRDEQTKLFLVVNERELEQDVDVVPLTYKVYNSNNGLLCNYESVKKDYLGQSIYTEELVLENFKESDEILKLEIYKADSTLITTLKIDLESRTIEVAGEEEALEKISEIELKEFLGFPSLMYNAQTNEMMDDDWKIWGAIITSNYLDYNLKSVSFDIDRYNGSEAYGYKVDDINLVLNSVYGMKVEELDDNRENDFSVYEKNGIKYFVTTYAGGLPAPAECIDITDISYCGGLYTVTYTFCNIGEMTTIFDVDINDYDIYEQTITLEINDGDMAEISKFRMVSAENPIVIRSADEKEEGAVEGEIITPNDPEKDEVQNKDENNIINNNVYSSEDVETVRLYFKGKWVDEKTNAVILIKEDMTFEFQVDGKSEKGVIEKVDKGGNEAVPSITLMYNDGRCYTYKAIQGSESYLVSDDLLYTYTYIPDIVEDEVDNTEENMTPIIKVDNYASTMSWTEYYAPGIKIKYPTIFTLEEIGGYYRGNRTGEISTLISGVATGVDPDTKEIINSNMIIKIYEPTYKVMTSEEMDKLNTMNKYTRADGIVWYEDYKPDENGGATYTHTSYTIDTSNPTYSAWEHKVIFEVDVDANYKVINIINWFLKSTDFISY